MHDTAVLHPDTLLKACVELAKHIDVEDLATDSIRQICQLFKATYGKILKKCPNNPSYSIFWVGYHEKFSNYWNEERKNKCSVPILSISEQRNIERRKRSIAGDSFATGNFHFIEDVETDTNKDFFLKIENDSVSEIIAPLETSENTIPYVLCLAFNVKTSFNDSTRSLVKKFCTLLGALLERIVKNENIKNNSDYQETLIKIVEFEENGDPFARLAHAIKSKLSAVECSIYVFSPDFKTVILLGGSEENRGTLIDFKPWNSIDCLNKIQGLKNFIFSLASNRYCLDGTQFIGIADPFSENLCKIGFIHIVFNKSCAKSNGWCPCRQLNTPCKDNDIPAPIQEATHALQSFFLRKQNILINIIRQSLREVNFGAFVTEPLQALQEVINKLPYNPIHIWLHDGKKKLYLALSSNSKTDTEYSTKVDMARYSKYLVVQAFNNKKCSAIYGDIKKEALFPDLFPDGTNSCVGYPVFLKKVDTEPFAVVSIFANAKTNTSGPVLSIIDEPVIEMLLIFISLFQRLHNALKERVGRQAVLSHDLRALLALIQSNQEVLYKRLVKIDPLQQDGTGGRSVKLGPSVRLTPRTHAIVQKNVSTCMEGIKLELMREAFLSGEWEPKYSDVRLHDIVAEIVALVRSMLSRKTWVYKDVKIIYDDLKHVSIKLDKQGFMRVLLNILINAVKYGADGTEIILSKSGRGVLTISNIGMEILENEEKSIFEKGVQGSNAKNTADKFANPGEDSFVDKGIGLYVARNIMQNMGGNVELTNPGRNGESVVFSIHFAENNIKAW